MQRCSNGDATAPDTDSDTDSDSEADTEAPTQSDSESKQLPPQQDAAREDSFSLDLNGVGLGRVEVNPSAKARRDAAILLNVRDVDPLVPIYQLWERGLRRRAREVDVHFVASARKIYRNASADVQKTCGPLDEQEPLTVSPARPTPSLRDSPLVQGRDGRRRTPAKLSAT